MKKSKAIILALVLVIVAGIVYVIVNINMSKVSENDIEKMGEKITQPFTSVATVKFNDITAVLDINKTSANKMTFNIIEPSALKDLFFNYDGENINISYKGLEMNLAADSVVTKSMVSILINTINSATKEDGIEFKTQDGALLVEGSDDKGAFSLKLDKDTGNFLKLSYPELELECNFDDFVFGK